MRLLLRIMVVLGLIVVVATLVGWWVRHHAP